MKRTIIKTLKSKPTKKDWSAWLQSFLINYFVSSFVSSASFDSSAFGSSTFVSSAGFSSAVSTFSVSASFGSSAGASDFSFFVSALSSLAAVTLLPGSARRMKFKSNVK